MKMDWYQAALQQWQGWRQQKPIWWSWAGMGVGLLLYYVVIVMPLNYLINTTNQSIKASHESVEWMARASREIVRLQQLVPQQRASSKELPFAQVNQSINEQDWKTLVTEVKQLDQDRVQVTFDPIPFKDLMAWLEKLYSQSGVHVYEASLERVEPGVVRANLTLEGAAALPASS